MSVLQIIFQILTVILTFWAINQKQKWKMMLLYTICNIACVFMFLVFDRYASMWVSVVATLRTLALGIYAFKQKKPNVIYFILFEVAFVVCTIIFWQDALDLFMLFAMLFVGYGSWQENITVLRITYIVSKILYIVYYAIIGAYISLASNVIFLISEITCFIYYCLLKRQTPILQVIFKKGDNQENIDKEN